MSQGKEAEIRSYRVECFGKPRPSAWPGFLSTVKIKMRGAEHSEYPSRGAFWELCTLLFFLLLLFFVCLFALLFCE